ncbi:hypothetical protein GL982_11045 (plasmid) [Spiroplasma citri]|uniref:Uncharacterized protein n=1 Tax=Spiroplasma citri TaxID=2133 RepID=Q4VYD5_SPICI|nr:hypothetical protein [Spiroplasma citri]QIA69925.1 hypothetical protein GL298_10875 [Spiroplasma citri]QIA71747.1 hypothetical protein GL981_10655 [Spiroplasma citri]QIA71948.1 hypothetical protein GL981_11670 [Spiroplasma citri]QIA74040.1 hypothetical protein GL982_10840 [Spiroplasma citri]QIA74080.1 hypothetical protein GL982_11045 [Spiroplasma citri]
METKQNEWVTVNILARRKLKRETEKAVLFSIPKHKGLSVWINKKCIHGSRNGKIFAVGIKKNDEYTIWIYDADSKQHLKSEIWQGQYLINLYQCEWNKMLEAIKINQEALNK